MQNGTIFVAKCYTDPEQKEKFQQELNIMKQLTNNCDLKCANILIDNNTRLVKLSDFGSAKQNEHTINQDHYFAKGLIGTLPWCAPEIICNKSYGIKVDIWSLWCCLNEMLIARTPWKEKNINNYYQCVLVVGKGNDIPEIPSNYSNEFKSFILRCLIRNMNERASVQRYD